MLDIPTKRCDRALVTFLTDAEVDALLESPDRTTWTGRRDHALFLLATQAGLRVSELTRLTCGDVHLGTGAHVSCHGKGRKARATPLTSAVVTVLHSWMTERAGVPDDSLFPTRYGASLSRDAIERRLAKYSGSAALTCTTLRTKKITAHVLRHTAAMRLLHAGVDTSVIALWLGHETINTTQIYLHAVCQEFPAKRLTLYREPTSLVLRQAKLPPAKPSFEDFVLLKQVDHSGLLVTLEPNQRWRRPTRSRAGPACS